LYGAEIWILWKVDQKCLASFEMCCWRRMERISWTDHLKNGEVLHGVKKEMNALHTMNRREASRIGHFGVRTAFQNTLLKEI